MRPARAQHGMTLLEVVLAVGLSVGVMGSAIAFYQRAVDVRARLEDRVRLVEAQRLIMDRITNELRAAWMSMEGQAERADFFAARLPGPAAWVVRKTTEDPIRPEIDLEKVGYRLRLTEDTAGAMQIDGLERTSQKLLKLRVENEEEDLDATLICPDIRFLGLRYWHDGVWLSSWTGGDLPQAVEITLGTQPLPEGVEPVDYPYDAFRRVVYLPCAPRPDEQGGGRPGGGGGA